MKRDGVLRTLLVGSLALLAFASAYVVTGWVFPDPGYVRDGGASSAGRLPLPRVIGTDGNDGIGPAEGLGFQTYDPVTGRPTARVVVDRYRRIDDTTVEIEGLSVSVPMDAGAGGVAFVTSPRGVVRVESPTPRSTPGGDSGHRQVDAASLSGADRAVLRDVRVQVFADGTGDGTPTFEFDVDNLLFDANRLVLETGETTLDGRAVAGDAVPVRVVGRDVTFTGRGLHVVWDAQARRPALVRVASDARLTVQTRPDTSPPTAPAQQPASSQGRPRGGSQAAVAPETPEPDAVPYRLTLAGPVEVTREAEGSEALTARAAAASALFSLASEVRGINPQADAAPSGGVATPSRRNTRPSEQRPRSAPEEPTTRPPDIVVVTWPGETVVRAAEPGSLAAGDLRMWLTGGVTASSPDVQVDAHEVAWSAAADRAILTGSAASPDGLVTFTGRFDPEAPDARAVVTGPLVDVRPDAGTARIEGAGVAHLPDDGSLRWLGSCVFTSAEVRGPDGTTRRILRRVEADGGVETRSDGLDLRAETLHITFDDAGVLATADARGGVVVTAESVDDTSGGTLRAARVRVSAPADAGGPLVIAAEGGVRTTRDGVEVIADRLDAVLADGPDGRFLDDVRATGDVRLADADGRTVRGDTATLAGRDAPLVVSGDVVLQANVKGGEGGGATLRAQVVVLDAEDGSLGVPAAGEAESAGRRLTWSGSLAATADRIDVVGDVVASAAEGDAGGGVSAGRLTLVLDAAGNVTTASAYAGVRLTAGDDGDTGRRFDLRADAADVTLSPATSAGPGTLARVDVPVPGRLLVRDMRPDDASGDGAADGGFRGSMALGWQEALRYDAATGFAEATGGVTAAVEPRGDVPPFTLAADAMGVAADAATGEVRQVSATGGVRLTSSDVLVEADAATWDPAAGVAVLWATPGRSVTVSDAAGRPAGRFARAEYDVTAGTLVRLDDLRAGG